MFARGIARTVVLVAVLAAAWTALPTRAQQGACPQLPAGSELKIEGTAMPGITLCRALDAGGTEKFVVMIGNNPPFSPLRRNRAEESPVAGQTIRWYRTQIALRPDVEAREASLTLADGRNAYLNVQAADEQALRSAYGQIASLAF